MAINIFAYFVSFFAAIYPAYRDRSVGTSTDAAHMPVVHVYRLMKSEVQSLFYTI